MIQEDFWSEEFLEDLQTRFAHVLFDVLESPDRITVTVVRVVTLWPKKRKAVEFIKKTVTGEEFTTRRKLSAGILKNTWKQFALIHQLCSTKIWFQIDIVSGWP